VSVSFTQRGDDTLVVLEHSGWEAREHPIAIRREYDQGWPTVLDAYTAAADRLSSAAGSG
jgi:hypothetical protein